MGAKPQSGDGDGDRAVTNPCLGIEIAVPRRLFQNFCVLALPLP